MDWPQQGSGSLLNPGPEKPGPGSTHLVSWTGVSSFAAHEDKELDLRISTATGFPGRKPSFLTGCERRGQGESQPAK